MRGFCLEVSGPYACFTRPEMKVERVSYDVITPSAARAIFEAILWKPAIRWQVKRIEVLALIRWVSVRRNEVGKVASSRSNGIFIEDERQQRAGLFLRDVKYRLFAEFDFIPPDQRGKVLNPVPEYLLDTDEAQELRRPDVRKDETEAKYASCSSVARRKASASTSPILAAANLLPLCAWFTRKVNQSRPSLRPAISVGCSTIRLHRSRRPKAVLLPCATR